MSRVKLAFEKNPDGSQSLMREADEVGVCYKAGPGTWVAQLGFGAEQSFMDTGPTLALAKRALTAAATSRLSDA